MLAPKLTLERGISCAILFLHISTLARYITELCQRNAESHYLNFVQFMKIAKSLLGEKLFSKVMKATFYGHFVAGEDEVQITPVLDRLRQFGVKPILDYSVEEDISQEEAERREVQ